MTSKDPVAAFLDAEGRLTGLPQKHTVRRALLALLAEKFVPGQDYTEKQVNAICDDWHTFGDYFVLRRELVDEGFLCRTSNGSRYWRTAD
ncbi:MAG: DUF2087 domain-containing protein [Pygmaiobacter sp.]|nr:DUF2087 domain-containing protein [Pygmaiobacter sp.]